MSFSTGIRDVTRSFPRKREPRATHSDLSSRSGSSLSRGRTDGNAACNRTIQILALTAALTAPCAATAQPAADFYRGKSINLLIGVNVGGVYDRDARLIARYLGSHIPGNPTIVPQNMIGGGGIAMANYLQNVAAKDGTYLGMMPNTLPMNQMSGMSGVRFDIGKFNWIGSMTPLAHSAMVMWHTTGVERFDDVRKREFSAGASPKGSFVYTFAALQNEFLGAKYKIVAGYQGIAAVYLAMERGEVDGLGVTWGEFKVERANMLSEKKVRVIVQSSPKADDLGDVPTVDELASNDDDRRTIDFLLSGNRLGRPLAAPAGVPQDRLAVLRKAFEDTMKDPRFIKDVETAKIDYGMISAATLAQETGEILKTPARSIERAKKILE